MKKLTTVQVTPITQKGAVISPISGASRGKQGSSRRRGSSPAGSVQMLSRLLRMLRSWAKRFAGVRGPSPSDRCQTGMLSRWLARIPTKS